jgi:hypothetical protein
MKTKNKKVTITHITFDDSKFGHEIQPSWEFCMTDAMWYCQAREAGFSSKECKAAWDQYQKDLMAEMEFWMKQP